MRALWTTWPVAAGFTVTVNTNMPFAPENRVGVNQLKIWPLRVGPVQPLGALTTPPKLTLLGRVSVM